MSYKVCKKRSYRDKEEAVKHLHYIQSRDDGRKKPIRAYECNMCDKWHLTSKNNLIVSNYKEHSNSLKGTSILIKELLIGYNIDFSKSKIDYYIRNFNNYEMAIGERYLLIMSDKTELEKFVSCIKKSI